jgi:biotin transport system substrate-specific component
VWSALPAFLSGTVVIYLFGITWLWYSVDAIATIDEALIAGMVPFVVGDLLKIALAGLLLPAAWKLVERTSTP